MRVCVYVEGGCGGGMGLRGNLRLRVGVGGQQGFSWRGTKGANLEQSKVLVNRRTEQSFKRVKLRSTQTSDSPVSVVPELMLVAKVKSDHTRSNSQITCFILSIVR